jgi:EmrB/QacA subfamily drug resistance transporter
MNSSRFSAVQRAALLVAILATFIAFLDGSVINVALPAIDRDLGGGLAAQQWIVDAYLLTLGAVILTAGALSDRFGRRRILTAGLIGFGVTSLACAVAPSALVLILSRGAQGIAGALLVPSSLAIILDAFAGKQQARAIGTWTALTSVASIAGPVLGGVLVDHASWRWVFAINLLPIAAALLFVPRLPAQQPQTGRLDLTGATLAVVGLGFPVYALIEQHSYGWDAPRIWGSLSVGVIALILFLLRERSAHTPLLPLRLFAIRNFATGNIATLFIYAAVSLGSFATALFLQQTAGYSATAAGLATLPTSVLLIGLSAGIGKLNGILGPRKLMTIGPLTAGAGSLMWLNVDKNAPYVTQVLPAVVLFGLGMSILVAPLTATVIGAVDSGASGVASAVNNAVSRVAGLVAIALAGSFAAGTGVIGFHQMMAITALLMFAGAVTSLIGVRDPAGVHQKTRLSITTPHGAGGLPQVAASAHQPLTKASH